MRIAKTSLAHIARIKAEANQVKAHLSNLLVRLEELNGTKRISRELEQIIADLDWWQRGLPGEMPEISEEQAKGTDELAIVRIEAKLDELIETVSHLSLIPNSDGLWDARQVAAYLGVAVRTVGERYAAKLDFPRAVRIAPGKHPSRTKCRWYESEVKAWVRRQQDKVPR